MSDIMLKNIIKYYENITDRAMESLAQGKKFQFRRNLTNRSLSEATKDNFQRIHNSENANKLIDDYIKAMNDMHIKAQKQYNRVLNQLKVIDDPVLRQKVISEYAESGIHGFTARNGAHWNIETYSNMYSTHVHNELYRMNVLENAEKESKFQVSDHGTICDLCIPYEGRILTRTQLDNSTLFHPRCRHFITEVRA